MLLEPHNSIVNQLTSISEDEQLYEANTLSLLASASYSIGSVRMLSSSTLANITTEGFPGARYHPGALYADKIENLAVLCAQQAFSCCYANVQPHSASSANLAVLLEMLKPGDTIMGLGIDEGGHLTHGSPASFSSKIFRSHPYTLNQGLLDYDQILSQAKDAKPKAIICGASSYPRKISFENFRIIADKVGAILIADISHISGLVAAGLHESPINLAHITTTSTYKQLLGPRGGLILSNLDAFTDLDSRGARKALNRSIFPLTQGTPDIANVAAKAAALSFANTKTFHRVMERVVTLANELSQQLVDRGFTVVTGGTDTHMVLLDLRKQGLSGKKAEKLLEARGILANRNLIPRDPLPPQKASGLRIGTNILAQRNFDEEGLAKVADLLFAVLLDSHRHKKGKDRIKLNKRVQQLCAEYPIDQSFNFVRSPDGVTN